MFDSKFSSKSESNCQILSQFQSAFDSSYLCNFIGSSRGYGMRRNCYFYPGVKPGEVELGHFSEGYNFKEEAEENLA